MDKYYDINDDKDTWFNKVKTMCDELGYASNIKDYKKIIHICQERIRQLS